MIFYIVFDLKPRLEIYRPPKDDIYLVYLESQMLAVYLRILYSVYSVVKLWIGQADKSHGHFKNFTVTLIFILPLTDGHGIKGGGGVRMHIARGVDENQCDIKILEMAVRFVSLADS